MAKVTNQDLMEVLSNVRVDVGVLKVHVVGNGGRGLLKRQDETEDWIGKHPSVCPATSKEISRRIVRALSIATGIIGLLVALSLFGERFLQRGQSEELKALKTEVQAVQDAVEKIVPKGD